MPSPKCQIQEKPLTKDFKYFTTSFYMFNKKYYISYHRHNTN